jgi:hypothetical protein
LFTNSANKTFTYTPAQAFSGLFNVNLRGTYKIRNSVASLPFRYAYATLRIFKNSVLFFEDQNKRFGGFATTIGLSTGLGLPVSTTHVLSSGIGGAMVAKKGLKNLQPQTIKNILLAWILTVPVTMILSGGLFLLFRAIF